MFSLRSKNATKGHKIDAVHAWPKFEPFSTNRLHSTILPFTGLNALHFYRINPSMIE